MPELDSLRGIAILLVLFFHGFGFEHKSFNLSGWPKWFVMATMGGWAGVNLFFVLSGFLITGILLDAKYKRNYYSNFYLRRALRILPAYYAVLILLCFLPKTGVLGHRKVDLPFLALSFFYLSNVVGLFGVVSQYTVLWSLAVEEQFYILWPTLVRKFSRRGVLFCAIFVIVACPLLRAITYLRRYGYGTGYTWLVADGLACGAVLAVLVRSVLGERSPMRRFSIGCMSGGAGILAAGAPFGILRSSTFLCESLRQTGVNLFFLGIVSATLLVGSSRFQWLVQRPLLQFFGWISYGLYLIHMMVFDFTSFLFVRFFPAETAIIGKRFDLILGRFVLGAGLSVAIAVVSRKYFEQYFLKFKDRWSAPVGRPDSETTELSDVSVAHSA
jgi:peptidoglycan/LPS O-acetylase OafA/YrhL